MQLLYMAKCVTNNNLGNQLREEFTMIKLNDFLEVLAGGEPIEIIDRMNCQSIDPKKGQELEYPFDCYQIVSIYSGLDIHKESFICVEVVRCQY